MLGGRQAREDAATTAIRAVRISTPIRPDLGKQMDAMIRKVVNFSAEVHMAKADEDVGAKSVADTETILESGYHLSAGARGRIDAHVALWRRCASGSEPIVILEDGLLLPAKFAPACAHLMATIGRVCNPSEQPVLLFFGGLVDPSTWEPQWLPTDLQQANREPIVLRETLQIHESCAYAIWPLAAKRLLSSLPVRSPVDIFLSSHLQQRTVRALVVQPFMAASATQQYTPVVRYRVTHTPRVAVRTSPNENGMVEGARVTGDIVHAIGHSADGNWIQLSKNEWIMVRHETLGVLLERLEEEEDQPGFEGA